MRKSLFLSALFCGLVVGQTAYADPATPINQTSQTNQTVDAKRADRIGKMDYFLKIFNGVGFTQCPLDPCEVEWNAEKGIVYYPMNDRAVSKVFYLMIEKIRREKENGTYEYIKGQEIKDYRLFMG